jgi:hypothetical protein
LFADRHWGCGRGWRSGYQGRPGLRRGRRKPCSPHKAPVPGGDLPDNQGEPVVGALRRRMRPIHAGHDQTPRR